MNKVDMREEFSIEYLTHADIHFYKTDGGLLGARLDGYDGRVRLFCAFPMSSKTDYISVRTPDEDSIELGLLENMDGFSDNQIELIKEELDRMYFLPVITKVYDVAEDFGSYFWHVETDRGERKFTVRDISNNLIFAAGSALILVDTDGNRYMIKKLAELGKKAVKALDIWL